MYRLLVVCSLTLAAGAMRFSGDPAAAAILAETRQLNADGSSDVAYAQEDGVLFKETTSKDGERRGSYEYVGDDNKKYRVEYVAGAGGFQIVSSTHVDKTPDQPRSAPQSAPAPRPAASQPDACQHQHLQHQLRPEPADGGAGRLRAGHGRHDNDHDDDAPPRPQELPHRQGVAGAQRQGLRLQLHPQRLSASLSHSLPLSLSTTRCRRSSPGWAPRLRRCQGRPLRSAPGRPRRGGAASMLMGSLTLRCLVRQRASRSSVRWRPKSSALAERREPRCLCGGYACPVFPFKCSVLHRCRCSLLFCLPVVCCCSFPSHYHEHRMCCLAH
ncbi:uncharacterized protein LOC119097586 [Pollicipes pollicipes]|uniref:uncharacterized protein LOC119097586 n=1 Tax=Pollicipes pollicipes TaxID=41117 RepID=UPI001884C482|nr:uncharacterized protein LOC119097586 [Pollicipes pollicipes]